MQPAAQAYHDTVQALADRLGQEAPDVAAEVAGLRSAWARPLPRVHRQMRLPADAWARLRAATGGGALGDDAYDRFLPPRVLWDLDRAQLTDDVGAAAERVVRAWLAMQSEFTALSRESIALLQSRYSPTGWLQQIDEADDTGGDVDALIGLPLDAAARRQLARLHGALPPDIAGKVSLPAVLAGLWTGSLRIPRLPAEWDEVRLLIEQGRTDEMADLTQVAAVRCSLLAENSIGGLAPDVWEQIVTWAYARASRWAGQKTLDPVLHAQLIAGWREEPLRGEPVGPGIAAAPVWNTGVIDAVTTGSLPEAPSDADVVVSRQAPTLEALLNQLDELEGLAEVKAAVHEMVQQVQFERARRMQGLPVQPVTRHLVLTGNPGTGKTTVARLIGRILHAAEVLPNATFLEVRRADLTSKYHGETEKRVRRAIDRARGGVLFIDEAHALAPKGERDDVAKQLIAELVAGMENQRDEFVLMIAGYPAPLQQLLASDPGLAGRFARTLYFPDLSNEALTEAFMKRAAESEYRTADDVAEAVRSYFGRIPRGESFSNAREARSLFETAVARLASRYASDPDGVDLALITSEDIPKPAPPGSIEEAALAQARAGIDSLTGLRQVKESLSRLADSARLQVLRIQMGGPAKPVSPGHFAFVGPPGTGKTTVALQLGQLFAALGLLRSGHVVRANRSTLVAEYIGQTAPKVRDQVQAALDGVLFIDEAYALLPPDAARDFGVEAVATLVEEMEKYRDRFVVVLAGYEQDIEQLLSANDGLRSRVANVVRFEEFTTDELRQVAQHMAADAKLTLDDGVAELIAERADADRKNPGFANARTVRNLLNGAEGRLATRLAKMPRGELRQEDLYRITAADLPAAAPKGVGFGFAPVE